MTVIKWMFWILPLLASTPAVGQQAAGQPLIQPQVVGRPARDGQVTTIFLAPRYATAIRMPEPINSVVVGDPAAFSAEHSDREPNLVFVKPITVEPAQTNLLISTTRGLQATLLLVSRGEPNEDGQPPVDFLMRYKPAGQFIIQPAAFPSVMIPQTVSVNSPPIGAAASSAPVSPLAALVADPGESLEETTFEPVVVGGTMKAQRTPLDDLLDRQRRAPLPVLYGQKPGTSPPGKELVKTGVSEVIDHGKEVVVLFSAVNVQDHAVELMPPQIQLGGKKKSGWIVRRSRWATSEQLPVMAFRMSRRRLGSGERADGVVVFQRPSFKQSNETLFLQMAESGAVDRPALAPIGFGISSFREEVPLEPRP